MNDSVRRKRIFIVDHMCVLPYGHNQGSVALFRRALASDFAESYALVPEVLPIGAAQEKGFTRCLSYPYHAFYYRRFELLLARCIKSKTLRARVQLWLRRAEKVLLTGLASLLRFDVVLWNTERNWRAQFKTYNIGSDDLIFFPSTDYYGAAACLDWIVKGKVDTSPRVHLRMICVMENASLSSSSACDLLLEKVRIAIAEGVDVSVSAETPAYVSYLARKLGEDVSYFPQPLSGDAMPMPSSSPIIAASIGSGRGDKGYFLLADIVRKTAIRSKGRISFEIQSVPPQDHGYRPDYEITLAKIQDVHILPAIMADRELLDLYRRSYVAVLPYDPKTYEHRGSAIFQEAIAFTRPVVCLVGAAFADLIERYKNGYACRDVEDIAAAIVDCTSIPPSEWDRRLTIARSLYEADVKAAIKQVLTGRPVSAGSSLVH